MNAFCYILHSAQLDRFYIGATQSNLEERILKHNQQRYGTHRYTAPADDWMLFLKIPADDYAHAIRIERKIKSMKSSKFIRNLAKYPEMVEKLIRNEST